ncbi:MAG: hypothetical protein WCP28_18050, partial [Actinomycetes bacterium]
TQRARPRGAKTCGGTISATRVQPWYVAGARVGMSVQEAETATGATFGEEGEFGSYDRCSFGNPGIVRKGNGGYVAVWAQEHDSENWNGPRTVESIAAYIPGSDYWNMVGCRKLH